MTRVPPLVLALYPNTRAVGYVLFETPLTPYDWGVREETGKHKNRVFLGAVRKLITLYRPVVVVLEDWTDREVRRCARIEALYQEIVQLCGGMDIPVEYVTMRTVRRAFAAHGATTKSEIAQAIASRIPALWYRVPVRKAWQPEHPRQTLFDAAALGLTFFQRNAPNNAGVFRP